MSAIYSKRAIPVKSLHLRRVDIASHWTIDPARLLFVALAAFLYWRRALTLRQREVERLIREASPLHIESLRAHDDPVPPPSTVATMVVPAPAALTSSASDA